MRRAKALLAFDPTRRPDLLGADEIRRLSELTELLSPTPAASLAEPAVASLLAETEILVTGWGAPRIGREVVEKAPRLALIAHLGGTVKDMLDVAVWDRNIRVVNAVAANALPVAEFALAAALFANKQVFRLQRLYRDRRRMARPWATLAPGLGNYRKTIGIVGGSRVGRRLIALLQPFEFTILVSDPFLTAEEARHSGASPVDLDTLLERSDVVSLHAPSTPDTRHMIDRRRLGLLRDGAVLINTARGALVDQEALIDETRSGRIDAIIDVTEPDELPPDSPLYDIPNVFLTPHIAGAQGRETERMVDLIFAEIARYQRGEPLRHRVRREHLDRLA